MKTTSIISFILVIVGAIVWMLIGLFNINIVSMLFGATSFISRTIYTLVGLGGLFLIFFMFVYKPFRNIKN